METRIFTRTNIALAVAGPFAALALTVAACADTSGAQQGTATPVPSRLRPQTFGMPMRWSTRAPLMLQRMRIPKARDRKSVE